MWASCPLNASGYSSLGTAALGSALLTPDRRTTPLLATRCSSRGLRTNQPTSLAPASVSALARPPSDESPTAEGPPTWLWQSRSLPPVDEAPIDRPPPEAGKGSRGVGPAGVSQPAHWHCPSQSAADPCAGEEASTCPPQSFGERATPAGPTPRLPFRPAPPSQPSVDSTGRHRSPPEATPTRESPRRPQSARPDLRCISSRNANQAGSTVMATTLVVSAPRMATSPIDLKPG